MRGDFKTDAHEPECNSGLQEREVQLPGCCGAGAPRSQGWIILLQWRLNER